jgi:hypothetical protein
MPQPRSQLYLYLHLAHGLISTPRCPPAETADPQAEQQLLAQTLALPPTNSPLLGLLALTPPLRLAKSLCRDLVQAVVFDAQLAPARPEVTTIGHDSDVERVRGVARTRESICRLARREAVEAEEVHEEARAS